VQLTAFMQLINQMKLPLLENLHHGQLLQLDLLFVANALLIVLDVFPVALPAELDNVELSLLLLLVHQAVKFLHFGQSYLLGEKIAAVLQHFGGLPSPPVFLAGHRFGSVVLVNAVNTLVDVQPVLHPLQLSQPT